MQSVSVRSQRVWESLYASGHKLDYPNDVFVRVTHRLLDPEVHSRVLDYGCGSGENLLHLARRGFSVAGVDISQSAVSLVRDRARRAGLDCDVRVVRGLPVPFPDASFDAVIAWQVLDYNDRKGLAMAVEELQRVLRPGGVALYAMVAPGDVAEREGVPLGDGLYEIRDGAQAGAVKIVLQRDQIPQIFPTDDLQVGRFVFEFDGIVSSHWIISHAG